MEPRMLLSADTPLQFTDVLTKGNVGAAEVASINQQDSPELIGDDFGIDEALLARARERDAQAPRQPISIPAELGQQVEVSFDLNGEQQTLILERNRSIRGQGFQVLLQQDDGSLVEYDAGQEANYIGHVKSNPGLRVSAVFSTRGLTAEARYDGGGFAWSITPDDHFNSDGHPIHVVSQTDHFAMLEATHDHDGDGVPDHLPEHHVASAHEDAVSGEEMGGSHDDGCCCEQCVPPVKQNGIDGPHEDGCCCEQCVQAFESPDDVLFGPVRATSEEPLVQAMSNQFINVPNNPSSRAAERPCSTRSRFARSSWDLTSPTNPFEMVSEVTSKRFSTVSPIL